MTKKEKCSLTQKGRMIIHMGDIEKRVYPNELDTYIQLGWQKGMSEKHLSELSIKKLNHNHWNKGIKNSVKRNSTTFSKGHTPWNKGKKGLQQAWNKGLTKEINSSVNIASKKLKDNFSEEHRKICSINGKKSKSNLKGIPRSKDVIKKISTSKKGHSVSLETRQKISNNKKDKKLSPEKLLIKTTKQYLTRKLNNTFNVSKLEDNLYQQLLNSNTTVYRQYKDERYPYYCDFYIPDEDLFIECNYHWTHGGRPYDPNDIECQKQLAEWQEKAKTSKYFQNAINTWTVRDVNKLKTAQENNLNYKVIY